jgi:hypothetical protein
MIGEKHMLDKYRYVEVIENGVNQRGCVIEMQPNQEIDYFDSPQPMEECYYSIYHFAEDFAKYDAGNGSKRGFAGSVGANSLHFDFDAAELENSKKDTITLCSRLPVSSERVRVYFSGNKGFHVIIKCPELSIVENRLDIEDVVKGVCSSLAVGLATFDDQMYNKTRIFRSPNTINIKSGLFKIPLTLSELSELSVDEIKELAKNKRRLDLTPVTTNDHSKEMIELIEQATKNTEAKKNNQSGKITRSEVLDGILNGFNEGKRNSGLVSIAGLLHRRNHDLEFIRAICYIVNDRSNNPIPTNEVDNIITSISRYSVDPLFVEPEAIDIITLDDASKIWEDLRRRQRRGTSGFSHLDATIPLFDPAQVMLIASRSGCFKTTIGMTISNNLAKSLNGYGLFASLEMPPASIYGRAALISANKSSETPLTLDQVSDVLLRDNELKGRVLEDWKNLLLIKKDTLSVEQIEQYFEIANTKYNGKINNMFIDYGGLISGAEDYQSISNVARGIKKLAKRTNTRVILIVQLSRAAKDGFIEPDISMLRDSGSWEESADYILSTWRDKDKENVIHAKVIKNRDGVSGARFDLVNKGLHFSSIDSQFK